MAKTPCRYLRRPPPEARGVAGEELWWPPATSAGVVVTEDTALRWSPVLATHAVLSTDVSVLPVGVFQRQEDGGRREAREHINAELLSRSPDGKRTPMRWLQALMGHALRRGNGFAEIQRLGNGRPYRLHLLDPKTTTPKDEGDEVVYTLGNGKRVPGQDILHVAGFGNDGLSGYNFTDLMRQGIGLGIASEGFAADYFANGAEPSGMIEMPQGLKDEARKTFRETWDEMHRGSGRRHRPAILQNGAKWVSTSNDPEKSQLVENRRFNAIDATRGWRVPPHMIGDLSEAHLANVEASNQHYLNTALMGWLVSIQQEFNLKLFTRAEWLAGYYVEFNVNALLRGDTRGRFEAYGKALADGWMSRDEVRRRENLNPIGADMGGDKYLVQLNLTTLDKAGAAVQPAKEIS